MTEDPYLRDLDSAAYPHGAKLEFSPSSWYRQRIEGLEARGRELENELAAERRRAIQAETRLMRYIREVGA